MKRVPGMLPSELVPNIPTFLRGFSAWKEWAAQGGKYWKDVFLRQNQGTRRKMERCPVQRTLWSPSGRQLDHLLDIGHHLWGGRLLDAEALFSGRETSGHLGFKPVGELA